MNAELIVVNGPNSGEKISLDERQLLIGREPDCQLRLPSELVSRHHCVFRQDEYTLRIRDLGSKNGTFVNGHRIKGEVVLGHGDVILVGEITFELYLDSGAETESIPDASLNQTDIFDGNTEAAPRVQSSPPPAPTLDHTE